MTKIMKAVLFSIILGAFLVTGLRAQGSYTAADCNQSSVNAIINGPTHTAVNGDTINIPACTGGVTWTSGVTISGVAIQIIGNGTPNTTPATSGAGTINTVIVDGITGNSPLFNFAAIPVNSYLTRLSLIKIQPAGGLTTGYSPVSAAGACSGGTCPNIRIDNINFSGWSETNNGDQASWMIRTDNVFGVVDHNTSQAGYLANVNHSAYLGVGAYGDNSWATPDSFGTASALYFENNTLNADASGNGQSLNDCDIPPYAGNVGGCRVVARFNTTTAAGFGIVTTHGTESDGRPRVAASSRTMGILQIAQTLRRVANAQAVCDPGCL